MAKKALTQDTTDYENITPLDPIVEDQATTLQPLFDKGGKDQQTFMNATLLTELADETESESGAHTIGLGVVGILANNVGDAILELLTSIGLRQLFSNLVTVFQVTPDDTHYPSEKLVKESLDAKATLTNVRTRIELESQVATGGTELIGGQAFNGIVAGVLYQQLIDLKQAVDDATTGTLPDGSVIDLKLSNTAGEIKDRVATLQTDFDSLQELIEMGVF